MADRPVTFSAPMVRALLDGRKTQTRRLATSPLRKCEQGDRLWVRESLYVWNAGNIDGSGQRIAYRATEPDSPCTWTPSIHMPRWASRLTLHVEAVRIEPLQAISRADAIAEGLTLASNVIEEFWRWPEPLHQGLWLSPPAAYAWLWRELHGADSWDANPDVIVLTFRVERGNIDRIAA
jgi:hypothetical protein